MTSTMSTRPVPRSGAQLDSRINQGSALMAIGGLAFMGYAVAFFVRNFTDAFLELGIGPSEVDKTGSQIKAFSPDLFHYISHLQIAVSGFVAATGLAVLMLSWFGVRRGMMWAWVAAVASPVLALAVALPSHYPWGFATLGHLGAIYVATIIFVIGAVRCLPALLEARRAA